MTATAVASAVHAPNLRDQYVEALRSYCLNPAETALGRGYELGRLALASRMSLLEIVMIHEEAVTEVLNDGGPTRQGLLRATTQFLAETLAPFEMAHRGFLEANRALRDLNDKLESEARRIAVMLHDGAGQMLFALQLALGDLTREVPMPALGRIGELLHLTGRLDEQLRSLSRELHPVVLDDLGLVPALELMIARIAKNTGLKIAITDTCEGRLPAPVERCLYRVGQEALSNAVKHAGASTIAMTIGRDAERITCSVRDDGVGIPVEVLAKGTGGLGLIAMRERLEVLDGNLSVKTAPGRGTLLLMTIPTAGL